jgi:hypothetical protein
MTAHTAIDQAIKCDALPLLSPAYKNETEKILVQAEKRRIRV